MLNLPFGQTVVLWRAHRHLTQEALAQQAGIPRPNLSAIERGQREVTLRTVRALAAALDIRSGVLVDGVSPLAARSGSFQSSRVRFERIAKAVAQGNTIQHEPERTIVEALRKIVRHRQLATMKRRARIRGGKREAVAAWLLLNSVCSRALLKNLLQRIAKHHSNLAKAAPSRKLPS